MITGYKDTGLVSDVFTENVLRTLPHGRMAIGHCRYATTGAQHRDNAQPLVIRHIKGGLALAHNGNLTNAAELRTEFELNAPYSTPLRDTEAIAYAITRERLKAASIQQAVCRAMDTLKGAYSLVIMSPRKLIAVRDPIGFRPLCIGRLSNGGWVVASESCALTAIGAEFVRDVRPGELITISDAGAGERHQPLRPQGHHLRFRIHLLRPPRTR